MQSDSGRESTIAELSEVTIAETPHKLTRAAWMPKGWLLEFEDVQDETAARALMGKSVYGAAADIPEAAGGHYVSELVGLEAIDVATGAPIGKISGIEFSESRLGHDWWLVESDGKTLSVPAVKHFIEKVDKASGKLFIKNLSELPQ